MLFFFYSLAEQKAYKVSIVIFKKMSKCSFLKGQVQYTIR